MSKLISNGYEFKPHEMPMMAGSPASPDLSAGYKAAYGIIGIYLSLVAGLQNGLLTASLAQIRGELSLTLEEGGWVQVAYFMTYACLSPFYFKLRQHFGLTRFMRWILSFLLLSNIMQALLASYEMELLARAMSGLATAGFMTLGIYYLMQMATGMKKLATTILGMGLSQLGNTISLIMLPFLYLDGDMHAVVYLQLGLTLLSLACIWALPLPPSIHKPSLVRMDLVSFIFIASGIACLCAFLVQGRIVWWDKPWLGGLLIGALALLTIAVLIERNRAQPLLDWAWIGTPQMLGFGLTVAFIRVLTSEQSVGASGLLTAVGMNNDQLVQYNLILLGASVLGLILSIVTLNVKDTRRPVVLSLLGIAIGAYLDTRIGMQTRAEQLYFSQALISFASFYFLGSMMLEGIIRAFSTSLNHIMGFITVFALSQTIGALAGSALFSAFITYQTQFYLGNIGTELSLTNPAVANQIQSLALTNGIADTQIAQSQAASSLVQSATSQATILAYTDLFGIIFAIAVAGVIGTGVPWLYRRYKGTHLLEKELAVLAKMMNQG